MVMQYLLDGMPDGAQKINAALSILKKEGKVIYLLGGDNYFSHPQQDKQGRRFALASLMQNGHVRASELQNELGIAHRTLMNWKTQCENDGAASFYRQVSSARPQVMTEQIKAQCAALLATGTCASDVAKQVGIKDSTLRKAIKREAIVRVPVAIPQTDKGSSKSERSLTDAQAAEGLGTACTRADERVAAAMGLAGCATARFEKVHDVQMGGLLSGLPALCANGLLSGLERHLKLPQGFYSALHILLVLGFMALGRIRRPEGLRQFPPGELGKVIGLDRAPEVRTLREKVALMASAGNPQAWMQELSKNWMNDDPDEAGYIYMDGHVRVYHGDQAKLPRRYVSRQRLCLRGTTDYWLNDALGRPFFVVSKAVTEGLADSLLKDIVPELLVSVPQQPTAEQLQADPLLHRFVMVFDREGSNHSLASKLWEHRIGALTYRKNVKDVWPQAEFVEQPVSIPGGGWKSMKLAQRETLLSAGKESIAVTEVRRLTLTGHQTAVITTARRLGTTTIASRMFARWCQENFFAYMMQHFDIDGLIEYGTQSLPGTLLIINPKRRALEHSIKAVRQSERKLRAELGSQTLSDGDEIQINAEKVEAIQALQAELERLRAERKTTPKKVTIDSLPEAEQPTELLPLNKQFTDGVKMIAYRAETALVMLLQRHLKKPEEARALIRELFVSSADIEPDTQAGILTIRIHRMANPVHDRAVSALLQELTQQGFQHPETGQKMIYELV